MKPGVSLISQLCGLATIESFGMCASKCLVSPGFDASLVKYKSENEVIVTNQM